MDCKQSKIDTLLQTSAVYLQQQSLIPDEIFLLQISKINSSKTLIDQNFLLLKIIKQSMLTMHRSIKTIKESIDDIPSIK